MYTSYHIFIVVFFGNSKELENEFILEEKKITGYIQSCADECLTTHSLKEKKTTTAFICSVC